MPVGIELFCAPRGIKVRRFQRHSVPLPHFSSIRLTEESGMLLLGLVVGVET